MKFPRLSVLILIGILAAGSTALGYYYYYVYGPPLAAAEAFMQAMENRDADVMKRLLLVSDPVDTEKLREPEDKDIDALLKEPFVRGRILDQRLREGQSRDFYYLVYRDPGGQVYAMLVTTVLGRFRIVVPEKPSSNRARYLWDYQWSN
jgi:hypothetical protein